MDSHDRWVEKIHPLTRGVETDDPMELMAEPVPGDPEVMLECLIDEFAWIGCDADELTAMFASPAYPVLNQLLGHFGVDGVRRRVEERLAQRGIVRFTEVITDEPDPDEHESDQGFGGETPPTELIQLSLDKIVRHRPA
jgi:hypothetical protein